MLDEAIQRGELSSIERQWLEEFYSNAEERPGASEDLFQLFATGQRVIGPRPKRNNPISNIERERSKQLPTVTDARRLNTQRPASRVKLRRTYRRILIAVFVAVTIVVAVFPVAIVTVMFTVSVPFSFFAAIPLTIVPSITMILVPFAVVSARYGNGELLR